MKPAPTLHRYAQRPESRGTAVFCLKPVESMGRLKANDTRLRTRD